MYVCMLGLCTYLKGYVIETKSFEICMYLDEYSFLFIDVCICTLLQVNLPMYVYMLDVCMFVCMYVCMYH